MTATFEYLGKGQTLEFNSALAGRAFLWRSHKTAVYQVFAGTTRVRFVVVWMNCLN